MVWKQWKCPEVYDSFLRHLQSPYKLPMIVSNSVPAILVILLSSSSIVIGEGWGGLQERKVWEDLYLVFLCF